MCIRDRLFPLRVRGSLNARLGSAAQWAVIALVTGIIAIFSASLLGRSIEQLALNLLSSVGLVEPTETRIANAFGTRSRQHASLLAGWLESPIWGNGSGAVRPDFAEWRVHRTRVAERPWRAELQYHLLLFEGGLIALGLYFAAFRRTARSLRSRAAIIPALDGAVVRSLAVGALALLITTASNPYVRGVGQQWVLFAPIGLAALSQMRAKAATASSPAEVSARR